NYEPNQVGVGVTIGMPGTFGHQIDTDIVHSESLPILTKTEHSCFSSEEFITTVGAGQIDTIFILGFLSEYCVKQTAIDALSLGYNVVLVKDCIGTGDDVQQKRIQTFEELKSKG